MNLPTVPAYEIERRVTTLQAGMAREGVDLALIRQNADLFYFTGTVQDGHLFIPASGEPLFLVWRSFERARRESPLTNILPLDSMSDLLPILQDRGMFPTECLGLEMDVIPANLYLRYKALFSPASLEDMTPLIREVRGVKSQWEISCIRKACQKVWSAMEKAVSMLSPGITDIEVASVVEAQLRRMGHPGVVRMRMWNHEIGMDQVLTGPAGALPSWTNTPAGGAGQSVAYGMGAGGVRLEPGFPLTVDIAGYHMGYICDQTRTLSLGELHPELERALDMALEIQKRVEGLLAPGVECGFIYEEAVSLAREAGLEGFFMGQGRDRVRFVGHGVGVELDEYPFLSKGNTMALVPGMVVAVEPKFSIPGKGMVGVEDTYLITEDGNERLTLGPERLRRDLW